MISQQRFSLLVSVLISNICLGVGLFAPCLTLIPQFGEFTGAVKIFQPSLEVPQTVSVIGGIVTLIKSGEYFVGFILLIFSVIFPIWKLAVLWGSIWTLEKEKILFPGLRTMEKLGKFSMLDVYVMAILVLAVKGLPGGSEVHIRWGLIVFTLAALLPLRLPHRIEDVLNLQAAELGGKTENGGEVASEG